LTNHRSKADQFAYFAKRVGGNPQPDRWLAYLVDDLGNRFGAIRTGEVAATGNVVRLDLPPEVPVRTTILFEGAPRLPARSVTLVLANTGWGILRGGATIGPIDLR
jgi:hypothetical protein